MLTSLELTERHIRDGEARVARQRQIYEDLARSGLVEPAAVARDLLTMMLRTLDLSKRHLTLARATGPFASDRPTSRAGTTEPSVREPSRHPRLPLRSIGGAPARRLSRRMAHGPGATAAEFRRSPELKAKRPAIARLPRQESNAGSALTTTERDEPCRAEGSDSLNSLRLAIGKAVSTGVEADALIGLLLEGSVHVVEHVIAPKDRGAAAISILQALADRLLADDADSDSA